MKPITDPTKKFRLLLMTSPVGIPAAVVIAKFTNPELSSFLVFLCGLVTWLVCVASWAYVLIYRSKEPNPGAPADRR